MTSGVAKGIIREELKPGDQVKDGTVYVGISPATGRPLYTTPADALSKKLWGWWAPPAISFTFARAQRYAARLDAHGHQDWRVPSAGELNLLFNNRAAIGGFDVSGPEPRGYYWSATRAYGLVQAQYFGNGELARLDPRNISCLRCVRG